MEFSAPELLQQLRIAISSFSDNRTGVNTRYSMEDIVLGAFSTFLTQSPSFLSFQRAMREQTGRDNGTSLFLMQSLPTDDQIRNVLDDIPPACVFPVFEQCFSALKATGEMKQFKSDLGFLVALDATQYFSSQSIHCQNCLTKTDKKTKEKIYYHTVITPVIVTPEGEHVLSLVPEYIIPQDGEKKQDCENKAAKRWLKTYGRTLWEIQKDEEAATILGDDLYSRQPVIETILDQCLHYLLVCKRESHPWLYDYVDNLNEGTKEDSIHTLTLRKWNGKMHIVSTYRFANHVPLKDDNDTLFVNWCEVTIKSEESAKILYHNAFITDHTITSDTIVLLIQCGRARWKIENENNNALKTKGYYFEHNFGHGDTYLSSTIATLILLAFLFHTLFSLFWKSYMYMLERVKRVRLFESIRVLSHYFFSPSWEHLFAGMAYALDHVVTLPTAFSLLPAG